MWQTSWATFLAVLPLLATFLLDRWNDRRKRNRTKEDFLRLIRDELEEKERRLANPDACGNLLYPFMWDSLVSSGIVRLLTREQISQLKGVYKWTEGLDYEAKRLRDTSMDYEKARCRGVELEIVNFRNRWIGYSDRTRRRERNLRARINELLQNERLWE